MTQTELLNTIRTEIERRAYNAHEISFSRPDKQFYEGMEVAYGELLDFLDTLSEQEHPIYALNQILLDWVREAKTDKEQEARFEAHKRFFELYDEYMVQEPKQPASEGLEEEIDAEWKKCNPIDEGMGVESAYIHIEAFDAIARHFAEWQKEQMLKEAIHYVVQDDLDPHGVSYNIPFVRIGPIALKPKGIGVGDKVKIIIIKEKE